MTLTSIIDSDNKYASKTRRGLHILKELTADLNGWELFSEQENVKLYEMKLDDTSLPPLVRGDTILTNVPPGCTPLAVATVATLPGCRKIWDEKYDESKVKEYYTRYESLFWVKLKAPWPISPRDFSGTSIRDNEPNTSYCSMLSVKDDSIPNTPGTVRGKLYTSGWKITTFQQAQHMSITFVNQVDLAGSLPAAFLKNLLHQIPMCAGKVRDYIINYGFAPTTIVGKHIEFKGEEFDHKTKRYTLDLIGEGGGNVETLCSTKMYSKGVNVKLEGDGEIKQDTDEHNNPRITLNNLKGPIHLVIESK